ncbi:MAG: T9SS type A sorting domain-containing protein [Bacteroidia bacterium]|nr:T9SS type A sorting domain-containing protein [Bacteroidia bacterium]
MKKIYFSLLIIFASLSFLNAQSYTQGNLTVNIMPNFSHDSSNCTSMCMFMYNIQKPVSFVNDTVFIKDAGSGFVFYTFVNTSGSSPWSDFAMIPQLVSIVPDINLIQPGNIANYFAPPVKAISGVDTIYNIFNMNGTTITDACSYNNVSGNLYVDQNSDCVFNAGDIGLQNVYVASGAVLSSPTQTSAGFSTYSNTGGNYNMLVQQSWLTSYNVYIPSQYQFIFPSTTCSPVVYNFTTLPQTNVDFSLQCGSVVDVQTWVGSPGSARPAIPFILNPVVSNTGCDSASGVLKLVLDNRVVYNAGLSSNPATSQNGDTLYWNYTNLTNLSAGAYWNSFFAGVYLTPNVTVNIGDTLCFSSIVNIPANDLNTTNNMYSFCIPVVNSYDPNIKEVSPAGTTAQGLIPASTPSLTYTIHFQNTGTAVAFNIIVVDTLSANVDAASLQIIESSHAMTPGWNAPGVVQFSFANIFLADSTSNEPASHGFVTFKVNLNPSLTPGTQITNRGDIYFDLNPAILTNTALNTIETPSGIKETEVKQITLLPNPASNEITISSTSLIEKIEIYSVTGELLRSEKYSPSANIKLDVRNLSNGIYFIRAGNSVMKKFVVAR